MILTVIRMPDLDGLGAPSTRRSNGSWPGRAARVVFVGPAILWPAALREFVSESGRPVIEKPFLPSEVRRVVAELTADSAALRD